MGHVLDRRTRRDADARFISPDSFFAGEFPALVARNGRIAAEALAALDPPPLAIMVDGSCRTIARDGETIVARDGETAGALVLALTPKQFSDWAQNQMSLNGFLVARALAVPPGGLMAVSIWDSVWIALLEGWPVVGPPPSFVDRRDMPLDLARVFTPADDVADIRHFLAEAGYLHLRGWLDPADMALISAEMDAALPRAAEGDGTSWWAQLADGRRVCVRLQDFADVSPTTAGILAGPRWADMLAIIACDDPLVPGHHVEALAKPVGVVAGPSDVTFHRDCHLGRHAYLCARRTIGIAITPTSAENGTLRVIAGSHRLAMPVEIAKTAPYLPVVAVETEAGDLTVHLSCTLHEATPPKLAERRVMYVEAKLEPTTGDGDTDDTAEAAVRADISAILKAQTPA